MSEAGAVVTACVTCGSAVGDRFCSHCGEMRADRRDHSLRHFLAHAVETFTQVDGKLWRTVRALLTRPGQLTAEFMRGRRNLFVPPLQLFLITNVVFFFMNSIVGFNTFTTPFYTHLYQLPYSKFARSIAFPRLAARDIPISDYALRFNEAIDVNARTLIIVMVPIFSLFVMAVYWRAKRYYVQHLAFSLHFYTFLLLLMSVTHGLTIFMMRVSAAAGARLSESKVDQTVTLILLGLIVTHIFLALRRIYTESTWVTFSKAVLLGISVGMTLMVYRLFLFLFTLYST